MTPDLYHRPWWYPLTYAAPILALAVSALAFTACGPAKDTTTTPAPTTSTINPVHAKLCEQFKAKADDTTRTDTAREAARREYEARCQDVG